MSSFDGISPILILDKLTYSYFRRLTDGSMLDNKQQSRMSTLRCILYFNLHFYHRQHIITNVEILKYYLYYENLCGVKGHDICCCSSHTQHELDPNTREETPLPELHHRDAVSHTPSSSKHHPGIVLEITTFLLLGILINLVVYLKNVFFVLFAVV